MPVTPLTATAWRTSTASNQPQRRLAAGDGAELVAALAELLADVIVLLGRERARADARGVGLDDAEHEAGRASGPCPLPEPVVPATVLDEVTNG